MVTSRSAGAFILSYLALETGVIWWISAICRTAVSGLRPALQTKAAFELGLNPIKEV